MNFLSRLLRWYSYIPKRFNVRVQLLDLAGRKANRPAKFIVLCTAVPNT